MCPVTTRPLIELVVRCLLKSCIDVAGFGARSFRQGRSACGQEMRRRGGFAKITEEFSVVGLPE